MKKRAIPISCLLLGSFLLGGCNSPRENGSSIETIDEALLEELNSFNYDYASYLDTPGQSKDVLSYLWDGGLNGYSAYEVETKALGEDVYYHGYSEDEDLPTLQDGVSSLSFSPGMDIEEDLSSIDGKLVLVSTILGMEDSLKWVKSSSQIPEELDGYSPIARLKEERISLSLSLNDGESLSLEYPYLRLCPYLEGEEGKEIEAFEGSSYLCLGLEGELGRKTFSAPSLLRPTCDYPALQSKAEILLYQGKTCLKTRIRANYQGNDYDLLNSSDIPAEIDDFGDKQEDFASCLIAEDGIDGYFDYGKVKELVYGI